MIDLQHHVTDLEFATELVQFAVEIVDVFLHGLRLEVGETVGLPLVPVTLPVQGQLPDRLQLVKLLSGKGEKVKVSVGQGQQCGSRPKSRRTPFNT